MSLASRRNIPRNIIRRFPPLHISTFIGILHLLVGILGAGIITAFSLYFIYKSGEQANLREVENLAFIVDHALEESFISGDPGQVSAESVNAVMSRYMDLHPEIRYGILRQNGTFYPVADPSRGMPNVSLSSPEVEAAMRNSVGESIRGNTQGQRILYIATTVRYQNSGDKEILVLAAPFDQVMDPTYQVMRWMGVIALLIVAFTVAEGWLGSEYISRPLVDLSKVAEQLSHGNLDARADPRGPVEVVNLSETLNEMASRLQNSLNSLRAFVANASHELRTPLTSIKLQVGALRSGAYEEPEVAVRFMDQIDSEIDRLEHMVNDMLDLSQIEGGGSAPKFEAVDIVDLASEVQAFWEARTHHLGLSLTLSAEPALPPVRGDAYQLRRLFDNLLDNAVKNTPAGGQIEIVLKRCPPLAGKRLPDVVRMEVHDTGIGIAADHLAHIFDRFYRIDPRPGVGKPIGSGLGLAIARSIAVAHGGKIGVNSSLGSGSTFWVELPVI